jgi:hypothetical protein
MPRLRQVACVCVLQVVAAACSHSPALDEYQGYRPITLTWDQPDDLADYFVIEAGGHLFRTEDRTVTLELRTDVRQRIEIRACNEAGCSPPALIIVAHDEHGWEIS